MIERVWIIGIGDGPPNMAFLTKEAADQCAELLVEVTKGQDAPSLYVEEVPVWKASQTES